jgi:hypothetical protein
MGGAKQAWEDEMARGWKPVGDKFVCPDCLTEPDIARHIQANATSRVCSYCDSEDGTPIAAHMDRVCELVAESIAFEWTHPAEELPYNGREGGYQGVVYDGYDLFMEGVVSIEVEAHEVLVDIARAFFESVFCERNWAGDSEGNYLSLAWRRFVDVVRNRRRFFFDLPEDERSLDEPWMPTTSCSELLGDIGALVQAVGLIKRLPMGTEVVRARIHDPSLAPKSAKELGTPPSQCVCAPSRMSPAGIGMFYGSTDEETVRKETCSKQDGSPALITFGTFATARETLILDLVDLPAVPSLFSAQRGLREKISFLRSFEAELTKPISKYGGHVDYVPTQIVTEYFRHAFTCDEGKSLFGIRYRSSHTAGACYVFFCDNSGCVDTTPNWAGDPRAHLALVPGPVKTMSL